MTLPDAPEEVCQFASSLAVEVKELIGLFSKFFVGKPNEFGVVSISGKENALTISVKMTSGYTVGKNFIYMDIKDGDVKKFLSSVLAIIEKLDNWDGVKGTFNISIQNPKKPRYYVHVEKFSQAPSTLKIIDCIDAFSFACCNNCGNIDTIIIPRKLLLHLDVFSNCKSLKDIHIV